MPPPFLAFYDQIGEVLVYWEYFHFVWLFLPKIHKECTAIYGHVS